MALACSHRRPRPAIEHDILGADLSEIQGQIAVRRQTEVATIDLSDGQRDPLTRFDIESHQKPGSK